MESKTNIKVLGISGSPRRNGNTDFLLRHALDAAESIDQKKVETEFYSISGKRFNPCISCFRCSKEGHCILEGDDFSELCGKWVESDAIIIATPVYHMGIPGQLKCFIDRLGNSVDAPYSPPPKRLKVYGAIAQGSDLFSGQENAITQIINHALIMGGVVISGDIPQSYIGAGGWTERNVKLDAIESSHERGGLYANVAIKASMSVGKRVAELALIIRAGVIHYAEYLDRDPVYRPLMERLKPS